MKRHVEPSSELAKNFAMPSRLDVLNATSRLIFAVRSLPL